MNSTPTTSRPPVTVLGWIVTQVIAFVGCMVVPAVITLVAPVTTLEFQHSESQTSATVTRFVLLWVPWKVEEVADVKQVRADITLGRNHRTLEERRRGHSGVLLSTGQVALVTDESEVIVQAAPTLAKQIVTQFDEFQNSGATTPLSLTAYASWPLTYILGGCVTALSLLYVTGVTLAVLSLPYRIWKRIISLDSTDPEDPFGPASANDRSYGT